MLILLTRITQPAKLPSRRSSRLELASYGPTAAINLD